MMGVQRGTAYLEAGGEGEHTAGDTDSESEPREDPALMELTRFVECLVSLLLHMKAL